MGANKTVYTIFGRHFIENSDVHFLYINAKNPLTKDNYFIVQTVNGSYAYVSNIFSNLDDLGNKDCAKEYWIEIYGHNTDDFFDALDNLEENEATTFIPIM
jgi:hypothetical protein